MARNSRFLLALLVLALLGTTSCTMWGEKKSNSWKTVTAGEELTRLFWQEVKQKNWTELSNHISATIIGVNAGGTLDRDGLLSHVKQMDISEFQVGEVQTQTSGEVLLVSYTLAVRGTVNGHSLPNTLRFMSVWHELKSGWVLVGISVVPVAQT